MYIRYFTSDTLHKKSCRIGLELRIMLEANFRELWLCEVRISSANPTPTRNEAAPTRSLLPRTSERDFL